jgi:outer membrane lipoprotein SlyB
MKTKLNVLFFTAAASSVLLTGCISEDGTPDNTGTGALTGGGVGAFTGAVADRGNPGSGALIGAAVGAIAGGLIGHSLDQQQQERLHAQAPQTYVRVDQGKPLGMADIKALAKAGVSDDVIISQIKSSHTVFRLSAADIIDLHNAGVSDGVVNFMINTQSSAEAAPVTATTVVASAPPPPPVETVTVIAPRPGYVWVDGEWIWSGSWVWVAGHWAYPPHPEAIWVRGDWGRGPRGWYRSPGHWR